MRSAVVAIVALLAMSAIACAQAADPRNAATWYQRAIEQYRVFRTASPDDLARLWNYDESQPITPELRAALARVQPMLSQIRRGAMQEYADFQLDYSQGFEMLLPHLNDLRGLAKTMKTDALVRLADGDAGGAVDRIADMYRISGHFGDDHVIISSLVGQAVFRLSDVTVQMLVDRGQLDPAGSATLLSALNRLGTTDPFNYVEAIAGEQDLVVSSMKEKFGDPGKRPELIAGLFGDNAADNPNAQQLMLMDQNGFDAAVQQYDALMGHVVEIFSMPDRAAAKAALTELEGELEAHHHGPLAALLLPAFGRLLDQRELAEKMLADRIAILQKLAAGEVKPEEIANAAVWYLRAVEMLEKIEPARLAAVRSFAADTSGVIREELAALLTAVDTQTIIDIARDGSLKKRCDFLIARTPGALELVPSYAPGMHDIFRLLRTDAVRLLRAGDQAAATDRLALAFRIVAHVGEDPVILSALIAHANFNKTAAIVQAALQNGMLSGDFKPGLGDAVERISRKDPFGYIGAILATRTDVGKRIAGYYSRPVRSDKDQEEIDRTMQAANLLNGDQLLYLLVVYDTMARAAQAQRAAGSPTPTAAAATSNVPPAPPTPGSADSASTPASNPLARLDDVISLPDVEAVQSQIPQIAPLLAQYDLEFLSRGPIPAVGAWKDSGGGNVADHIRQARADLRRIQAMLRPPPAPNPKPIERAP